MLLSAWRGSFSSTKVDERAGQMIRGEFRRAELRRVPGDHRVEVVVRRSSPVRPNTGDSRAASAGLGLGAVEGDDLTCLRLDIPRA
jgi:hypothetical protein